MNIIVIIDQYNDVSLVTKWFICINRRLYNVLVWCFNEISVHYLSYITRINVKRFYNRYRLNDLDESNIVMLKELILFYYRTMWIEISVRLK